MNRYDVIADRVARAEDGFFARLESAIGEGHAAAAIAWDDVDRLDVPEHPLLDGQVLARVRSERRSRIDQAVRPLVEAAEMAARGHDILEVSAPDGVFGWFAIAVTERGTRVVGRDVSRFGRLVGSRVPLDNGQTFGQWAQTYAERSGVAAANRRRADAVQRLRDEYGDQAGQIVEGVRLAEILEWAPRAEPPRWFIRRSGTPIAQSELPPPPTGTVSDRIIDAVCREAYGAVRADHAAARGWELRYEFGSPPVDPNDPDSVSRFPGVTYESDDGEAMSTRAWRGQIIGDWTLRSGGSDPTAATAIGLADGSVRLDGAIASGLHSAEVVVRWMNAGLSARQAQVLYASELGVADAEIAAALKVAKSTVRNTRSAARKKLRAIPDPE